VTDSEMILTCRNCLEADSPFLAQLYAVVHTPEFSALGLPAEMLAKLLQQQSFAQETGYRQQFPNSERRIVEVHGAPVGRMVVDIRPERLHLVDIALMPAYHRRGIGGELLKRLIAEAAGRPIGLHVSTSNPARRLYEQVGFRSVSEQPPYLRMEYP
jgi:ribosomal protein S18 acetylase RimI-like enzyme